MVVHICYPRTWEIGIWTWKAQGYIGKVCLEKKNAVYTERTDLQCAITEASVCCSLFACVLVFNVQEAGKVKTRAQVNSVSFENCPEGTVQGPHIVQGSQRGQRYLASSLSPFIRYWSSPFPSIFWSPHSTIQLKFYMNVDYDHPNQRERDLSTLHGDVIARDSFSDIS